MRPTSKTKYSAKSIDVSSIKNLDEALGLIAQRNAELEVIKGVQEGLAAQLDMEGIYSLIGDKIRELFDAQVAAIAIFNTSMQTEQFAYFFEGGSVLRPEPRPIDSFRKILIKKKELICMNENVDAMWTELTGEEPTVVPGTKLTKSALFVPMLRNHEVQGYVSIQNVDREHAFSDSDIQLLSTLVTSMTVALENARLFNETEQRNAELAVINSVQQGLVAEMDMQGIYNLIGDQIRELFDAQVASISIFNIESDTEEFTYIFEDGKRLQGFSRPMDTLRRLLLKDKELIYINENADERWKQLTGEEPSVVPGTKLTKSALFVPMLVSNEVIGYISLQNVDREHAFSDYDIQLMSTLVNSMSVALENAKLFNETEQRNAELAVINSVQQGLVAEMDLQGIYDLVGDKIRDLFDAQVTGIYSFNLDEKTEHFHYLYEDGERLYPDARPLNEIRRWLIAEKRLLLINENVNEEVHRITGEEGEVVPGTRHPQSMLFVPLMIGSEVNGCVSLQNLDKEHAFSDSDVRLLSTLANSMTVALENARLFNEANRLLAETEQRNAELAVINSVQEGLVREIDMEAIYDLVGNRICKVLNTQTLMIRTFDHEKGLEIWEYAVENGERMNSEPRPFIWANKHLIKSNEPLLINEKYVETAQKYGDTELGVSVGLPPKSAIFVPMIVGKVVMGSVSIQNIEEENVFTQSDLRLLTTLTNSMSVAIENARLFKETTRLLDETEQRASELQTVNNISKAMVSQLEFDSLIKLVGDQMKETFNADVVYLALHDRKTDMLNFPYLYGEESASRPFGNGITENIILNKKPILVNEKMDEVYDKIRAEVKGTKVQSYLGVPISVGSEAIGVISVQSTELKNRFNEYDQRLLTTIAANVGVAIQNAEAYHKLQETLTELKSTQEQLVHSEKMASLGELTAGIAHEIQNPLNFVNNFSELSGELTQELKEELDKGDIEEAKAISDDLSANLVKINHHGNRASDIVKSMLQHSRTGNGEKELTDINGLADECLRLSYHGLRAKDKSFNADFKIDLDDTLLKVEVIPQDMGRVLLNLINNAFHATAEKAKSGANGFKPIVEVITENKNSHIHIIIRDNGSGIPDSIKEKIFQPFFTTKATGSGTGLGLSMSYDIVTKGHGGEITLESEEGIGTKFIISIPIKTAKK